MFDFHILRSSLPFQWFRGCCVQFLSFMLPDSFSGTWGHRVHFSRFALRNSYSVVPVSLHVVFKFYDSELIFYGSDVVASCFFALPWLFSPVPGPVHQFFIFYAFKLIFDGSRSGASSFHILRFISHFLSYRGLYV
jgi:hypothetical protein